MPDSLMIGALNTRVFSCKLEVTNKGIGSLRGKVSDSKLG